MSRWDRIMRLALGGRLDRAIAWAERYLPGSGEDIGKWPYVKDPNEGREPPRVVRWVQCDLCEGSGGKMPRWAWAAAYWDPPEDPMNFFEECPECEGRGKVARWVGDDGDPLDPYASIFSWS